MLYNQAQACNGNKHTFHWCGSFTSHNVSLLLIYAWMGRIRTRRIIHSISLSLQMFAFCTALNRRYSVLFRVHSLLQRTKCGGKFVSFKLGNFVEDEEEKSTNSCNRNGIRLYNDKLFCFLARFYRWLDLWLLHNLYTNSLQIGDLHLYAAMMCIYGSDSMVVHMICKVHARWHAACGGRR